jgi:hypothetical protein
VFAGCISKVECSVGGNLELRQTLGWHSRIIGPASQLSKS